MIPNHSHAMLTRTYLDHAAGTPVDPQVERTMRPYFLKEFGNPGSLHSFGQEAIAALDAARESFAGLIGADFREVVFTGSATEANNLALRGAVRAWNGEPRHRGLAPRIIVSAIEHESVLETAADLAREGAETVYAPVDGRGAVDPSWIAQAIGDDGRTAIVSVMHVNNETGTVQPVAAIADAVRELRIHANANVRGAAGASGRVPARWPLFHTDAVQAFPYLSCDMRRIAADMMTLSAHKICGPKGVGALFVRTGTPLAPIVTGGGQEFGFRSGTENVPLIAGFAKAAALAAASREKEAARLHSLRDHCIKGIKKTLRGAMFHGPTRRSSAAPHIVNFSVPGRDAADLVVMLDLAGIAVSSGSACRARAAAPSYVLRALHGDGLAPGEHAPSGVRVSFGRTTTKEDVNRFLRALKSLR